MNLSKQFTPKNTSSLPIRHSNVKVWGQQNKRATSGLDRVNSNTQSSKFKSFTADKDKISKIFAPKLTVIDNNILVSDRSQQNIPQQQQDSDIKYNKGALEPELESSQLESQTNNIKNNGFLDALLPKISFGKYAFDIAKTKSLFSKSLVNKNSNINTQQNKPGTTHDPKTIFQKLNSNKKQEPKANFFLYIKTTLSKITSSWWDSIKFDFYEKQWFRRLNYQFVAFGVAKNLNRLIVGICLLGVVGFFTYLSIFDQYFTIKKYTVQYSGSSYLNNQQTFDLISHFQKNKLYKVFPNNQYWFANNLSLTASAKEIFPEIQNVSIKNRIWPDKVAIQVETNQPILTLWVTENNQQKYWRINDNGKISSQDKAALWYNLVKVEKPYSIQGNSTETLSLFNHSFENDPSQKQRFKLTKQLFDYFKSIDIQIITTTFPSISDTDIIMESSNGTKFLFDSLAFEPNVQIERLDYFLKFKSDKSDFYEKQIKGDYAYFDFRIAQKVHICKTTQKCNIKPE